MARPTGEVCRAYRRMARDRGEMGLRTTDQAVQAPENALRCWAEPMDWATLPCRVGGSAVHPENVRLHPLGERDLNAALPKTGSIGRPIGDRSLEHLQLAP